MQKYIIFFLFLFIFVPIKAYAGFIDSFNNSLQNLGENLSNRLNNFIQKPNQTQYIELKPKPVPKPIKKTKIIPKQPIIKKKIAVIGDWQASYLGNYLKNLYEKNNYLTITNLASGCQDTTSKSCYGASLGAQNQEQLTSELQALKDINPDLLIIFLGANENNTDQTSIKEQIQNFINKAQNSTQHIIWLGTPPFHIGPKDKYLDAYIDLQKRNNLIQANNDIYKNVIEQNQAIYIDLWQDFLNAYNNNQHLLVPDTAGYTEFALKLISNKLQPALQDLSNNAKENYKENQNFTIVKPDIYNHQIVNINETLDHSPILLGGPLESRENAILKPQFNDWPPKGRADYFNLF